jgi:uncharacterized cupin superfamily protein
MLDLPPAPVKTCDTVTVMANVHEPDWDASQDKPPFSWRRSRLGRQAGAQKLGASLFELAPGCATFPLHVHHANEEMIIVLSGRPTLRSLDSKEQLESGDVVACPSGGRGAHRLDNDTPETVQVLIVSTMLAPDINEFPETGEAWARSYAPGTDPTPDAVELWDTVTRD